MSIRYTYYFCNRHLGQDNSLIGQCAQQYTDIVYYSIVYIYTDIVSCKHYGTVYTNIAYTISM